MTHTPTALSTGQAARFCLVTGDTILNWIKKGHLQARRTAGGQYRILVEDLRSFMLGSGIETDLLDGAFDIRRYCWEFCGGAGTEPILGLSCEDCLVRRSRALNCFELRCAMSSSADDFEACSTCAYLAEWRLKAGTNGRRVELAAPDLRGASREC